MDAVWAIVVDAPQEALEKIEERMTIHEARANPDRETWGVTPEQQKMMKRAQNLAGAGTGPQPPPTIRTRRGDGRPA